jgi:protein associated with RNAse G/E
MYEAPVDDKKYCTETAPLVSDKQRISQLDFDLNLETAVFLIKKKHLKDQASCTCD